MWCQSFSQAFEVNVNSGKSCWSTTDTMWWSLFLGVFLPENQSNHEKNTHQISIEGILQTVWLVFLKTDMVIKTRSVWEAVPA